jgi:hypothetical protein
VTNGNSKKKYTTLILGAGASEHLGYPLGRQLVKKICELKEPKFPDNTWTKDDFDKFIYKLSRCNSKSIDAHLEYLDTNEQALGKFLIVRVLKSHEEESELFGSSADKPGWYEKIAEYLYNERGEFKKDLKPLAVVTFNYDRSLEAFLHLNHHANCETKGTVISRKESWKKIQERLKIIHVHGVLGSYPKYKYKKEVAPDHLLKLSEEIKVIHEINDGYLYPQNNEGFSEAKEILFNSNRIVFMGFGFHKDSLRRLGFSSHPNEVLSFGMDGDINSNENFERIRFEDIEILASCASTSVYKFEQIIESIDMPFLAEKLKELGRQELKKTCNFLFEDKKILGY